jgi:hypothetical protein
MLLYLDMDAAHKMIDIPALVKKSSLPLCKHPSC